MMRPIRLVLAATLALVLALPARAAERADVQAVILHDWYRLVLELVRHTPTYSPPVASRAFAYVGILTHEVQAAADPANRVSLAGQVTDLTPPPEPPAALDVAVALDAALARAIPHFFGNTGPTGQRAMTAMTKRQAERAAAGVEASIQAASAAWGRALADHIIAWSLGDGRTVIDNLGFPASGTPADDPADWVPTTRIALQQAPLLPDWGTTRTFALPAGHACQAPPPPAYDETPGSPFHAAATEVQDIARTLTEEQARIARFWSDDPMLSPTPPGHWVSIVLQVAEARGAAPADTAEALALTGIAIADAFIGCWQDKFAWNLLRPVTYIKRVIDPAWEPLLITPPFPEYPSGHSVQSGAAEVVLSRLFGAETAFVDGTHLDDGLPERAFASFAEAAEEAAISRLYGGIHYRFGVEGGLVQGRCIGAFAAALRTRR
jgi:membrane-associated phospholipid phosphatase